jgi:hypothetical protein
MSEVVLDFFNRISDIIPADLLAERYRILHKWGIGDVLDYIMCRITKCRNLRWASVKKILGDYYYEILRSIDYRTVESIYITPDYIVLNYSDNNRPRQAVIGVMEGGRIFVNRTDHYEINMYFNTEGSTVLGSFKVGDVDIHLYDSNLPVYRMLGYNVDINDLTPPYRLVMGSSVRVQGDLILNVVNQYEDVDQMKKAYIVDRICHELRYEVEMEAVRRISDILRSYGLTFDWSRSYVSIYIPSRYGRVYGRVMKAKIMEMLSEFNMKDIMDITGFYYSKEGIKVEVSWRGDHISISLPSADLIDRYKFERYIEENKVMELIPVGEYILRYGRHVIRYHGLPPLLEIDLPLPWDKTRSITVRAEDGLHNRIFVLDWIEVTHPEHNPVELDVEKPSLVEVRSIEGLREDQHLRNYFILIS